MNKYVVGAIATALFVGLMAVAGYYGDKFLQNFYTESVQEGIDMYHKQCYTVGGYVIDKAGRVVMCRGLTTLPKKEVDKMLQT